jgi:hypothetical protein
VLHVQARVLDTLAEEVWALLSDAPPTLIVVGAYHIGKERVYLGLAKRLGLKVCARWMISGGCCLQLYANVVAVYWECATVPGSLVYVGCN